MVLVAPALATGALTAAGGFAANKLLGGLFGGGGGGGGSSVDPSKLQMELMDKVLGYKSDTTEFLDDYVNNVFMDAEKDYLDSPRSRDYFDNVFGAVQSGDLDYYTAQNLFSSAYKPNSEFYSTDYGKFLEYDIGKKNMNQIAQDAFSTNLMRPGTAAEIQSLRKLAGTMGMDKSPMQFASFANSQVASSLEGQDKGPYTPAEQQLAARYGGFSRNPDGSKRYTVNPIGGRSGPTMSYTEQYGLA